MHHLLLGKFKYKLETFTLKKKKKKTGKFCSFLHEFQLKVHIQILFSVNTFKEAFLLEVAVFCFLPYTVTKTAYHDDSDGLNLNNVQ